MLLRAWRNSLRGDDIVSDKVEIPSSFTVNRSDTTLNPANQAVVGPGTQCMNVKPSALLHQKALSFLGPQDVASQLPSQELCILSHLRSGRLEVLARSR